MALGLLAQACGLAWFALVATRSVAYGSLVVPLIVAGVGISMAIPTTPAAALGAVSPADAGKASGVNSTLQRFGGAFGVAVVTAVFSAYGHVGSAATFDHGFRPALGVAAGLSALGALTALLVRRRAAAVAAQPVVDVAQARAAGGAPVAVGQGPAA